VLPSEQPKHGFVKFNGDGSVKNNGTLALSGDVM